MAKMAEEMDVESKVKVFVEWLLEELKNGKGNADFFGDCRILLVKYFTDIHAMRLIAIALVEYKTSDYVAPDYQTYYVLFTNFLGLCFCNTEVTDGWRVMPLRIEDPFEL